MSEPSETPIADSIDNKRIYFGRHSNIDYHDALQALKAKERELSEKSRECEERGMKMHVLSMAGEAIADERYALKKQVDEMLPSLRLNQAHTCSVSCTRINGEVYKHSDDCLKLSSLIPALSQPYNPTP